MSILVVTCSLHDDARRESLCRTIEETYASRHENEQDLVALSPSTFAVNSRETARSLTQALKEPIAPSKGDWLITHEMNSDGTSCFGAASPEEWFDASCFRERLVENVVTTILRGPSEHWSRDREGFVQSVRAVANDYLWGG